MKRPYVAPARETFWSKTENHGLALIASGYPRPLPGVPRSKNLHGISFAVANATGFVVRACEGLANRSYENICAVLAENSMRHAAVSGGSEAPTPSGPPCYQSKERNVP
jgi:hypothetical protein